jgi:hypothetical protein
MGKRNDVKSFFVETQTLTRICLLFYIPLDSSNVHPVTGAEVYSARRQSLQLRIDASGTKFWNFQEFEQYRQLSEHEMFMC